MPNARMQPAGTLAFSWSNIDPVLRGSILAYPFSWLEASYQYADVNNALYSDVSEFSGSQTYKDKSFDVKIQLLKERAFIPAIAIGARDIAGTGIFGSEYFVFSKKISNFDFTIGLGWGNLSYGNFSNPLTYLIGDQFENRSSSKATLGGEVNLGYLFRGNMGLFSGIEYYIPNFNGARIKIEYDSTDYTKEGFPFGRDSFNFAFAGVRQPQSRLNLGIVYPISEFLHLKASVVKGNTLNFGFSFQLPLANKNPLFKKNDPLRTIENKEIIKDINSREDSYLYLTSLKYLGDNNLYLQNASVDGKALKVTYSQSKHSSLIRSSGRVASILNDISPDKIQEFQIINLNGGLGMHKITIPRKVFNENKDRNIYSLVAKDISLEPIKYNSRDYLFNPRTTFPDIHWNISPSVRSQIGGPDGFYFGDLRLAMTSEILFSRQFSVIGIASYGLADNFDELKLESDSILPHVRTDIVKYLKSSSGASIRRLQFNYFMNLKNDFFMKISGGILEEMFGGIGFEALYRPFYKNYGIGIEAWKVKQREYDMLFDFRNYETLTGHVNMYYHEPKTNIILAIKGGRFLAEDSGFNFDFSRRFKSGLRIGAFFSLTDISKQEFGEGSFDKGFYFFYPIDAFFQRYSKSQAGFGLRPLTRDGAQYLHHSHNLWGVTEYAQANNLLRDFDDLYD